MRIAKIVQIACALVLAGRVTAATTSEVFLHVNPSTDDYWHVAASNSIVLHWEKPAGASSADFAKTVMGRTEIRTDIAEESVSLDADGPVLCPNDERVFDLELTFDDPLNTSKKASVAFLADVSMVRNPDGKEWRLLKGGALLPVPASSTALTVDGVGVPLDTFDGLHGWWQFAGRGGTTVAMTLEADDVQYSACVVCFSSGLKLIFR